MNKAEYINGLTDWRQIIGLYHEGLISEGKVAELLHGSRLDIRALTSSENLLVVDQSLIPAVYRKAIWELLLLNEGQRPTSNILIVCNNRFLVYPGIAWEETNRLLLQIHALVPGNDTTFAWALKDRYQREDLFGFICQNCRTIYTLEDYQREREHSIPRCVDGWEDYQPFYRATSQDYHWLLTLPTQDMDNEVLLALKQRLSQGMAVPMVEGYQTLLIRYWSMKDATEAATFYKEMVPAGVHTIEKVDA